MDSDKRKIYKVSSENIKKMQISVLGIIFTGAFSFIVIDSLIGKLDIGNIIFLLIICIGLPKVFKTHRSEKIELTTDYLEHSLGKTKEKMEFQDIENICVVRGHKNNIRRIVVLGKGISQILWEFENMDEILEFIKQKVRSDTQIKTTQMWIDYSSGPVILIGAVLFMGVWTTVKLKFQPAQLLAALFSISMGGYYVLGEIRERRGTNKLLGIIVGLILIIIGILAIFDALS